MKFISVAIALLATAAIVSSHPVYESPHDDDKPYSTEEDNYNHEDEQTSNPWYYPATTDSYSTSTYDDYPTSTYDDYSSTPTETVEPYCVGFTITSPSGDGINYDDNSNQTVEFDYGTSNITEVEYIDLVKYPSQDMVDEYATGPWNGTSAGPHEVHIESGESGYYQFRVKAATADHDHCYYYSVKFNVTYKDDSHRYYNDATSTSYDDATSTSYEPESSSTY